MKRVCEDLNTFVRNQNPVKSLGLGYEGKIRTFFRSFNIFDENYEVKETGEIVFNRSLYLGNTQISTLPANLTVHGGLYLGNTQISTLPANLTVNGDLVLNNTLIKELPDDLYIKYNIYVSKTQKELIHFINHSRFKGKIVYWE